MEFTLSLALLDFLPVLFTGIGLMYIGHLVSLVLPAQGRIAFAGGMLVLAGGFFRAAWKLLMAVSSGGVDINWMEDGLFVFMTPGYILLAWSVWQTMRAMDGKITFHPWAVPMWLTGIMLLASYIFFRADPGSPVWERILLSVMVMATVVTGVLLISLAFRIKLFLLGGLFAINLLGIFILNGLARLPDRTIAIHWMAEAINTICWLAFAVSARGVYHYWRANHHLHDPVVARLTAMPKAK